MRMISLLVLGAFWLVACDRSTEPKVSSPSGGATGQPRNQAAAEPKPEPNAASAPGADHAKPTSPQDEPTRKQEAAAMPLPGQANDHSTTARDLRAAAEPKPEPNAASTPGADHAKPISPQDEPTRQEEDTAMPLPGQATGEL